MAKKPRKKFDTGEGNLEMIKNSVTAIKHHADELTSELKKNPEIEAWVLAKVDRAAQNLSDVTHYLDGEMNKFAKGGKTPIVRTQFEEEEFEYAKGGVVAQYRIIPFKKYETLALMNPSYELAFNVSGTFDEAIKKAQEYVLTNGIYAASITKLHPSGKALKNKNVAIVTKDKVEKYANGGMARGGEPKPSSIPDYSKISSVEVDGIDTNDAPDFVDAYITYAEYDGEPMSDEQLEELNNDGDFVYSAVERHLYAKGGKIIGKQKKLDLNKNGKLDAEDFKMLRKKRKKL
jgi:hypothetical protein